MNGTPTIKTTMLNTSSISARLPSRPRTLIHPGPFNPVRISTLHAPRGRHLRLTLSPGLSLFDALVKPLHAAGIQSASTTLLGGYFSSLFYCVAPPDPSGQAVIAYTEPIDAGAGCMIFGNATMGWTAKSEAIVHCHAAIQTAAGDIKGGHILTSMSIIGPQPITVLVTSLDGFELRVAYDSETNISLLQPQQKAHHE